LDALRQRLAVTASVRRDGAWRAVSAPDLVPGDIVKLSPGGMVAADVRSLEGGVLLDQSTLTGELPPIEGSPGTEAYAGYAGTARRGDRRSADHRRSHRIRPHRRVDRIEPLPWLLLRYIAWRGAVARNSASSRLQNRAIIVVP
jgi:magnesium-transporting ATPase (P-type)